MKKMVKYMLKQMLFIMEKLLSIIPDSIYLRITYFIRVHRILHLKTPRSFNEKIQWLKLHDHNPAYKTMVDKYDVREYVCKAIGEDYLVPLLGVWNCVEDIEFDSLPERFVLKCTHDSGGVVICRDKANFDIEWAKKTLKRRLKRNFYLAGREWPYKDIQPRIIAEKYMEDNTSADLKDYKFMCYDGVVKYIFTCTNRTEKLYVDFFDSKWNHMPFERHYPNNPNQIEKPKNLEQMIKLAEILAKGLKFVRVDLYEISNKVYFGELTFYPGSGFEEFRPEKWDYILGEDIVLTTGEC